MGEDEPDRTWRKGPPKTRCLFKYPHITSVFIGGSGGVGSGPRLSASLRYNKCMAINGATSSVRANNGTSKTGHEDATLQGLASRKGTLQQGRAAVLSLTPSCLSSGSVGAVEQWMSSSLGCGPRGPCLILLEYPLA